jgi:hypothetical protein
MDEAEKKFQTVDTVLLLMLAVTNDALLIVADLTLPIPVIGVIAVGLIQMVSAAIWAIILFWFIMKLGFAGRIGVLQLAGQAAEMVGLPGRTATVAIGIWLANHPKVAAVASTASALKSGGKPGVSGEKPVPETPTAARKTQQQTTSGESVASGSPGGGTEGQLEKTSTQPGGVQEQPDTGRGMRRDAQREEEEGGEGKGEISEEAFGAEALGEVSEFKAVEELTEKPLADTPKKTSDKEKSSVALEKGGEQVNLKKAA